MPTSKLLWGAGFLNELTLADPLFDIVTDREPRDGYETVQSPAGSEDAWWPGADYTLSCTARYLPDGSGSVSSWSGPTGWQAFLDWMRQKNACRFVPDQANPSFYVDGCYLVDPLKGGGALDQILKRDLAFKLRNPTLDFHRALRGILFEYTPGTSLTDPLAYTFARASTAAYRTAPGLIAQAASGVLRDQHYQSGLRGTLLEPSLNNWCLQSQAWATSPWTLGGTAGMTVTNNAGTAPDGTATASLLVPNAVSGSHVWLQNISPITSGEFLAVSAWFKASGYTGVMLNLSNTGAPATAIRAFLDLSNGTVSSATLGSGVVLSGYAVEAGTGVNAGWYRLLLWGAVNNGLTALQLAAYVYDTYTDAVNFTAYAGDGTSGVLAWGAQLERRGTTNAWPPTSYIPTTTTTATRAAETLTAPFTYVPQAMWFYHKFIERGTFQAPSSDAGGASWWQLGNASPRALLTGGANGVGIYHIPSSNVSSAVTLNQKYGDAVELLGLLYPDGSVQAIGSLNGGADVPGVRSGSLAFASAWAGNILQYVNGPVDTVALRIGVPLGGVMPTSLAQVRGA